MQLYLDRIKTTHRHCTLYKDTTALTRPVLEYYNNHIKALNTNAVSNNQQMACFINTMYNVKCTVCQ